MSTYKVENLTFTYPGRDVAALSDINLEIRQGEFVTLCGPSGSGKTTLLRHLKPYTTPHGAVSGEIFFDGKPIGEFSERDMAAKIGFVFQSPENQIVTDKVWHELAFGLECLGFTTPEIRLRVSEMASFFGIQTWFHKSVTELSGGQRQILALASIMALQPSALILDEPTSQLDPIAAGEFLATVGKINRELGVTVVLTEHRLEEAFPLSSRVVVMDGGRVIADGVPREVGLGLSGLGHGMFLAMPTPMRVWAAVRSAFPSDSDLKCPITVRDGADWLNSVVGERAAAGPYFSDQALVGADDSSARFVGVTPGGNGRAAAGPYFSACAEKYAKDTPKGTLPPLESPGLANSLRLRHVARPGTRDVGRGTRDAGRETMDDGRGTRDEGRGTRGDGASSAVSLYDVWFRYGKDQVDVVKGLDFRAFYGEVTAILGGNGTGKSTTLSLIAGLNVPYRGKVSADRQVIMLPQNPQSIFVEKTVREDLLEILSERNLSKAEKESRLAAMVKLCRLEEFLDFHPYDLSGGEQQRTALAKVLLLRPKILLLDEPTKGLDAEFKQILAAILEKLTKAGVAVIMASHDVEFCAQYADRCALFFDGNIVTENNPHAFFSGNSFYTTASNRMARNIIPDATTPEDIVLALGGTVDWKVPSEDMRLWDEEATYAPEDALAPPPQKVPKLTKARKIIAAVFGFLWLFGIIFAAIYFDGFNAFIGGGSQAMAAAADGALRYVGILLAVSIGIVGVTMALAYKREKAPVQVRLKKQKLSRRTIAAAVIIILTIPITIYAGSYFFGDRRYYFISLLIILQTMLPFALVFESRKPQARELVVIAVLCAIAVAGRAALFMLPQFKPVIALVIIAAVAFGGEAGFLVGAMTGFVSNFFFGQGPWTPYQMFALGFIGLLAGVLFQKGILRRSPASLAVFGALATFIIYGGILNPASVIIFQGTPTLPMILAAYLQGIPMDLVHAAATVTFILILSKPMLEKLDRIKEKYGLVS